MKYKKGMRLKAKTSSVVIELTSKYGGNGHWNTKRVNSTSKVSHKVHEGTLDRFYEVLL